MAWLEGWTYRKSHEIIGSSYGDLTDYPVRVVVHYGSGADNGEHVYLNGKCRSDFGDIRFTDSDGETELPYWMEKKVDGGYAIFWVKIPFIPASPDTAAIYIYYGNPSATTTSDGEAVFMFFDGFDQGVLDTNKWHLDEKGGTYEFIDSHIYLKPILNQDNAVSLLSLTTFVENIEVRAKLTAETDSCYAVGLSPDDSMYATECLPWLPSNTGYWLCAVHYAENENGYSLVRKDPKIIYGLADSGHISPVHYELIYVFRYLETGLLHAIGLTHEGDEIFDISATDTRYLNKDKHVVVWQGAGSDGRGGYSKWDWVFVRPYVDPEPSHGAWGAEESTLVVVTAITMFPEYYIEHANEYLPEAAVGGAEQVATFPSYSVKYANEYLHEAT